MIRPSRWLLQVVFQSLGLNSAQASMVECYNEEYRDLLGRGPPAGKKHQARIIGPVSFINHLDLCHLRTWGAGLEAEARGLQSHAAVGTSSHLSVCS